MSTDKGNEGAARRANPFFGEYKTPHGTVPFNDIRIEDYEEAIVEGIRREDEYIRRVTGDPSHPTFDNTLLYKDEAEAERCGLLTRVTAVFYNMLSTDGNDAMYALAAKMQPLLTKHYNDIRLNERLFERVRAVHSHHRRLSDEEKRLLDDTYDAFTRSGALLDEKGKAQLRRLSEELDALALTFNQNLLKEQKAFALRITDERDLDGLPESTREAARAAAEERGEDGWTITLDAPVYGPFMTYSTRRDLREKLYMARNTLCTRDGATSNIEVCRRIVNVRREMAQLLGYDCYADLVLRRRMASCRRKVSGLFRQLIAAYKPVALREVKAVERMSVRMGMRRGAMRPWDFSYYSHKLRKRRYDIDAEMLRPYFELSAVVDGVFGLATRLYGITFNENEDIQVWHPDVRAYDVHDVDGTYIGVLYADFFPREGKRDGAWMTTFQEQWISVTGENVRPHVSIVMNFTKPTAERPSLLTLSEVQTLLHEFGHALHELFSNVRFASLSGTNVWQDFVELPSQFMENYATQREFLRLFAFHYQTGEPLPDALISRVVRSRTFLAAYSCMRQVCYGLLDMAYYSLKEPLEGDMKTFEKAAWREAYVTEQLPDTCMTVQFSHIMSGGYAAGYYSYKWAEVLDADAFSVFIRRGIFDRATAERFRQTLLSRGATRHPMSLYTTFRRGKPTINALLRRDGVKRGKEKRYKKRTRGDVDRGEATHA